MINRHPCMVFQFYQMLIATKFLSFDDSCFTYPFFCFYLESPLLLNDLCIDIWISATTVCLRTQITERQGTAIVYLHLVSGTMAWASPCSTPRPRATWSWSEITWHFLILHDIVWYWMVSHDILWYCMTFYGIEWYWMTFYGIEW